MSRMLFSFFTLIAVVFGAPAQAKKDPCATIKPEQQLATEKQHELDTMVKVGVMGMGKGEAQVSSEGSTTYDTKLLAEDDLAKSWYVYQMCVMKRDGVLSSSLHDALMRELFGLAQQTAAAPGPQAGGAPTTGCMWGSGIDMVKAGGSSVVINGKSWIISNEAGESKFLDALNDCNAGEAAIYYERWRKRKKTATVFAPTIIGTFYVSPWVGISAGSAKARMVTSIKKSSD
jgi:hypothetical protein